MQDAHAPTVFIVDDDESVRASLELLVRSAGWQPEAFSSAREFLARPPAERPSCLLLDFGLPDLNGLEVQALLAGRGEMPIIFVTGYGDVPMTVRAMQAGAVDFLTKPYDAETLLFAIRRALERSATALAHNAHLQQLRGCYESLSRRERQVMTLVVDGRLNKQVGGELGISEITVKAHRGKLMRKMQANSFADLVRKMMTLRVGQGGLGQSMP